MLRMDEIVYCNDYLNNISIKYFTLHIRTTIKIIQ